MLNFSVYGSQFNNPRSASETTHGPLALESSTNEEACLTRRIAVDIGWRIAYKRPVPQRGPVNGGVKSDGKETQEGQENLSEKVAQVQSLE
jgi:hypothetical protein